MALDLNRFMNDRIPNVQRRYVDIGQSVADAAKNFSENRRANEDMELRKQELARAGTRDANTDQRDRIAQEQRARELLMQDKRQGQREDLYALQENRHQEQGMFDRKQLMRQQHEALIHELYGSLNDQGQEPMAQQNRVKAAMEALKREGYGATQVEDTPAGPTAPPAIPAAAPAPAAPQRPMGRADQATSNALDQADQSYSKGLGVAPGLPGAGPTAPKARPKSTKADNATSRQLDDIDKRYMGALQPQTPYLPGRSPIAPQVAQSNAMLDPADPYNQIVK